MYEMRQNECSRYIEGGGQGEVADDDNPQNRK